MADLARAIVDLSKAAEGRRGARKQLLEATNVVGHQIRVLLRTGDKITVETPDENRRVVYECVRVEWTDQRDGRVHVEEVLARADAILEEIDAKPKGPIVRAGRTFPSLRVATAEERLAFIEEAPDVAAAFVALLEDERAAYERGAAKATKVVPR